MPSTRRTLLAAAAASLAAPAIVRAQGGRPVVLGTLTPLTGSGGSYGPVMRDAVAAVVRQANAAGGIGGREVRLVSEDDQTNPDAGLRGARKLIDADGVAAIVGTWASSVTAAVAPLCWESRTFLTTVSGADGLTLLPHNGYLVRTQPNSELQGRAFVAQIRAVGGRRIAWIGPQTPYAEPTVRSMNRALQPDGVAVSQTLYDPAKSSFRSEVDQGLRGGPDIVVAGGFTTDTAVLLRDLYRAGFKGRVMAFGFAVNEKFVAEQPREATEGVFAVAPSPALDSPAYKAVTGLLGGIEVDTYSAQVFDQANLVLLAMTLGGGVTGTVARDNIRRVSQGDGPLVTGLAEGLAALAAGARGLRYDGASGPCRFNEVGDITEARFRVNQVQGGRLVQVGIV